MSKLPKQREARHIRLYHWMRATAAWQDLDCNARCAYIELAGRYSGTDDRGFSNNGRIPMSLLEMATALHTSKTTAKRAVDSLIDHGFIVIENKGRFTTGYRQATEYRLTEFPHNGVVASKDFARWPNLEAGAVSVPGRVPIRNRSGTVAERLQKVTATYGSVSVPEAEGSGSATVPLVVYQGESEAEAKPAEEARPQGARDRRRGLASGPTDALLSSKVFASARAQSGGSHG
jgi:hypothetical protein